MRTFSLANACGIPAGAVSVAANVTAVSAGSEGIVSVHPGGPLAPAAARVNFAAGTARAVHTILGLSRDSAQAVGVANDGPGPAHVLVDVSGYLK